jgi:hypothetical protein
MQCILSTLTVVMSITILPVAVAAQAVIQRTADDNTGAKDTRMILRSTDWHLPKLGDDPDEYLGASLIVACGERFPSDSGRSLLLYAGEPLEPFGDEEAYVELRLHRVGKPQKLYLPILDRGFYPLLNTGARSNRYLAFFPGSTPYFSGKLLGSLMSADTIWLAYRTFGRMRQVTFLVAPLRLLPDSVPQCHWPT